MDKISPGRWLVVATWIGGGGFLLNHAVSANSFITGTVAMLFMAAGVLAMAAPHEWF